ncbi:MAG: hypothetical protein WDM88_08005 [Galbitalea sp.]
MIGPIGNEFAALGSPERVAWESAIEIYESVIRGACIFLDIEPVRADQIAIAGDINDQVFRRLYESDLVIADMTGANANVMYELGLRHSIKALTIQVADADSPLPFDIKAVRTIMINRTQFGLVDARKRLTRAIEEGLSGELEMVAATRVWEGLRNGREGDVSVYIGDPEPIVLDEGEGFVEIMFGLEESFGQVTASLEEIGECLTEMNEEATSSSVELTSVSSTAPTKDKTKCDSPLCRCSEDPCGKA